jgi:hypothetical protein
MNSCKNCDNPTKNAKFCSISCANSKKPKRKRTTSFYKCSNVGCTNKPLLRRKYCSSPECQPNYVDWSKETLASVKEKRKYQIYSRIRTLSRKIYLRSDKPKKCIICAYAIHFDVCHIRGISTFPDTATVKEINSPDNLIALCKNHHWEFDNGFLSLEP